MKIGALSRLAMLLTLVSLKTLAAPFSFTAIPDEDETRLVERFGKVALYLEQTLGTEVRYVPVKSYPAAVTAFRLNQVQLAWFGGLTGVQARRLVPGSRAIAQGAEDREFRSYFIAHRSTGLKPSDRLPESIRGMSFSFGAKSSTSGHLMPEFYLRERFGEPSGKIFSRIGFSGNHDRTIALVESGAYQLGALNYQVWESAVAAGKVDTEVVTVIWRTPAYPDYHWVVRGDLDEHWGAGFADRVREALTGIRDPEILASFPRSAFVTAEDALYEPIERTAKELGFMD